MNKDNLQIRRRDFLKGMMLLAGAAVLPEMDFVEVAEQPPTTDRFIAGNKPKGAIGSVKLDGVWYSLAGGCVTRHIERSPIIWHPSPDRPGQYDIVDKGHVTSERYTVTLSLGPDGVHFYPKTSSIEFEIDARWQYSFKGLGYVTQFGVNALIDQQIEYDLVIEGVEHFAKF